MKTVLIGMGNSILSDDAVGVRLAKDFRRRIERAGNIADLAFIEECSLGGLNMLDVAAGHDRLIVLDSIKTQGGIPGHWYYFTATSLCDTMNLSNVHDVNFATALELGRRLGQKVPAADEIHIFAVEVQDNISFNEAMTTPLETAYPAISDEIFQEVLRLLTTGVDGLAVRLSTRRA